MSDAPQTTETQIETKTTEASASQTTETQAQTTGQEAGTQTTEVKSLLSGTQEAEKPPEFDAEKLTLPDGFDKSEANTMFTGFASMAKELGLTLPQAQKLVDFHLGETSKATQALQQSWTTTQEGWIAEVKADKEVGNLEQVRTVIAKVMNNREFTDPKFEEALAFTGAGNHPAVVRTIFRWAQALSEGGPVAGSPGAGRNANGTLRPSPAEAMYPGGPRVGGPNLARN